MEGWCWSWCSVAYALILSAFWLSAVVLLAAVFDGTVLVWHFWNLLRLTVALGRQV